MLRWIAIGAGFVVPLLLAATASAAKPRRGTYALNPNGRWGPVWRSQQPPGLPSSVRPCSDAGEAEPWIIQAAESQLQDPVFIRTVLHLAKTESGQMFGRPANNYDNRPEAQRPVDKGRISAWGCFQWNEGAGRGAGSLAHLGVPGPGYDRRWMSHGVTAWEEIAGPVRMYAQLWRAAIKAGGTPSDAARLVRLWHRGSGWGKNLLEQAQITRNWSAAYASVAPVSDRATVDRHLRDAGVLT